MALISTPYFFVFFICVLMLHKVVKLETKVHTYQNSSLFELRKRSALDFLFSTIIYTSIVLPSGSIFNINVKLIALLLFIALLFLKKQVVLTKTIIDIIPISAFLFFYALYSFVEIRFDNSYVFGQFKDILVFFIFFYICTNYTKYKIGYQKLIDIVINSVAFLSILKVIILIYSFISGLSVASIMMLISNFFDAAIMSFDLQDAYLARINFASDSILPFCIFYLTSKLLNGKIKFKNLLLFSLIIFSTLLTMSRYQWFASIVAIFLAIIFNFKSFKALISSVLILLTASFLLTLESVQSLIDARFDQKNVTASDLERIVQKNYIYDAINNAPFFGNGMGYYVSEFIRSDRNKYSYELQIPALIMQFGFIGFSILILFIVFPLLKSMNGVKKSSAICYFTLTMIWLAGAMFNPIIFSSSSGVILALIYVLINSEKIYRKI